MKTTIYFYSNYYENNSNGLPGAIQEVEKKKNDFLTQSIINIEKIDSEELIPIIGSNGHTISLIIKLIYYPKKES